MLPWLYVNENPPIFLLLSLNLVYYWKETGLDFPLISVTQMTAAVRCCYKLMDVWRENKSWSFKSGTGEELHHTGLQCFILMFILPDEDQLVNFFLLFNTETMQLNDHCYSYLIILCTPP